MNKFTKSVLFSEVKIGQPFSYGEGIARVVYVKTTAKQAQPRGGQTHHVYGFDGKIIVRIEP